MKNHDYRSNGELVRRRFRLYQILQQVDNTAHKEVQAYSRVTQTKSVMLYGKNLLDLII